MFQVPEEKVPPRCHQSKDGMYDKRTGESTSEKGASLMLDVTNDRGSSELIEKRLPTSSGKYDLTSAISSSLKHVGER